MKKSRHFLTVLMALGLLAFGAGCSSDDSGSGEGSDYTPEIPEGGGGSGTGTGGNTSGNQATSLSGTTWYFYGTARTTKCPNSDSHYYSSTGDDSGSSSGTQIYEVSREDKTETGEATKYYLRITNSNECYFGQATVQQTKTYVLVTNSDGSTYEENVSYAIDTSKEITYLPCAKGTYSESNGKYIFNWKYHYVTFDDNTTHWVDGLGGWTLNSYSEISESSYDSTADFNQAKLEYALFNACGLGKDFVKKTSESEELKLYSINPESKTCQSAIDAAGTLCNTNWTYETYYDWKEFKYDEKMLGDSAAVESTESFKNSIKDVIFVENKDNLSYGTAVGALDYANESRGFEWLTYLGTNSSNNKALFNGGRTGDTSKWVSTWTFSNNYIIHYYISEDNDKLSPLTTSSEESYTNKYYKCKITAKLKYDSSANTITDVTDSTSTVYQAKDISLLTYVNIDTASYRYAVSNHQGYVSGYAWYNQFASWKNSSDSSSSVELSYASGGYTLKTSGTDKDSTVTIYKDDSDNYYIDANKTLYEVTDNKDGTLTLKTGETTYTLTLEKRFSDDDAMTLDVKFFTYYTQVGTDGILTYVFEESSYEAQKSNLSFGSFDFDETASTLKVAKTVKFTDIISYDYDIYAFKAEQSEKFDDDGRLNVDNNIKTVSDIFTDSSKTLYVYFPFTPSQS